MNAGKFAAAAILVFLAGCAANPIFEGGRSWEQGWREGKVEQIGMASQLGYRQTFDCRYRNEGAGRNAAGIFAVVGVHDMGRHRHHVVPVEPGKEPHVGSAVITNLRNCEPPHVRSAR